MMDTYETIERKLERGIALSGCDFDGIAKTIETLYESLLTAYDERGTPPMATQQFLLAMSHLELARRHCVCADIEYIQGR